VRCKVLAIKRNIAKWTPVGMGIVVSWPNPQVSDARLGAGKNSKRVVSPDVNWKAHSRTGIMVSVLLDNLADRSLPLKRSERNVSTLSLEETSVDHSPDSY